MIVVLKFLVVKIVLFIFCILDKVSLFVYMLCRKLEEEFVKMFMFEVKFWMMFDDGNDEWLDFFVNVVLRLFFSKESLWVESEELFVLEMMFVRWVWIWVILFGLLSCIICIYLWCVLLFFIE